MSLKINGKKIGSIMYNGKSIGSIKCNVSDLFSSLYYLFKNGNTCDAITGGWSTSDYAHGIWSNDGTTHVGEDSIIMQQPSGAYVATVGIKNMANFSGYSYICIDALITKHHGGTNSPSGALYLVTNKNPYNVNTVAYFYLKNYIPTGVRTVAKIPISSYQGSYYLLFNNYSSWYSDGNIYRVWLE